MDVIVTRLAEVVRELTGLDARDIESSMPLVQLGLDSLVLTQLSQRLRREFGVEFSFRDFFGRLDTLDAIGAHILEQRPELRSDRAAPDRPGPAAGPVLDDPTFALASSVGGASVPELLQAQLQIMARQLDMIAAGGSRTAELPAAEVSVGEIPATDVRAARLAAPPPATPRRAPVTDRELTAHQETALRRIVQEWSEKTAGSKAMVQRQRARHADPRTAAGFDPRWKELVYPLVIERSHGPHLWDIDHNRYVDLLNGFGPTFFGHSPEFVTRAIQAQLERGFEIGPQTALAGEAAAIVCELTGLDRASFVCTGSEAVQAAIRAARTYTGRDQIVVFDRDYHGNFDEVLVHGVWTDNRPRTFPSAPGIPQRAVDDVVVLEYGADRSLEEIRRRARDLAAVIVEPVQTRAPDLQPAEFLRELRAITREAGSLLVFDEVVTGFRCHPGGAQAVFGVEADLCTFGKVLGGGLPIGVVAGRRPFIDVFDGGPWEFGDDSRPTEGRTFFAGTFVRHPLAIAAAHAALVRFKEEGGSLQDQVNQKTADLAHRLDEVARRLDLPLQIPHFASIMYFRITDSFGGLSSLFFHLMRDEGVFLLEGFPSYLTTTHEAEHLDMIVEAFERSGRRMQESGFWPSASTAEPVADEEPDIFDAPPEPGARLGRGPDGSPAWYREDPDRPGTYVPVK